MELVRFSGLDPDGYCGPMIWVRNCKFRTAIVTRDTRAAANFDHKKNRKRIHFRRDFFG